MGVRISRSLHSTRASTSPPPLRVRNCLDKIGEDIISMVFTHLPLRSHYALFLTSRRLATVARLPASRLNFSVPYTAMYIRAVPLCIEKVGEVLRYQASIQTLDASLQMKVFVLTSLREFQQYNIIPRRLLLGGEDIPGGEVDLMSWIRRVPEVQCRGGFSPHFCKLDNLITLSCCNFQYRDLVHLPSSLHNLSLTFVTYHPARIDDAGWHHLTHTLTCLRKLELEKFPVRWTDSWWMSLKRMTLLHTLTVSNLGPNPTTTSSTTTQFDTLPLLPTLRYLDMSSSTSQACTTSTPWTTSREWHKWSRWMPQVEQLKCSGFCTTPDISTWTHLRTFIYLPVDQTEINLSTLVTTTYPHFLKHFSLDMYDLGPGEKDLPLWPLYITVLGCRLTHLTLSNMCQGREKWTMLGRGLPHLRSLSLSNCGVDLDLFRVLTQYFSGLHRFALHSQEPPHVDVFPLMSKLTHLVELEWCCYNFDDTTLDEFTRWCPRSIRSLTTLCGYLTREGILHALSPFSLHLQHWYLTWGRLSFSPSQRLKIDSSLCTLHYYCPIY